MGCCGSVAGAAYTPGAKADSQAAAGKSSEAILPEWTLEQGDMLQRTVDRIFSEGEKDAAASGLSFSFTIADPLQEGCPLVGCSSGFRSLTGYELCEIIGRNCRFLVDPVPSEQIDQSVRQRAKSFCEMAAKRFDQEDEKVPSTEELICVQTNAHKSGALFRNMFYLHVMSLGERPYIIGLQAKLEGEKETDYLEVCQASFARLMENMAEVERILAGPFWSEYNGLRWQPQARSAGRRPSKNSLEHLY